MESDSRRTSIVRLETVLLLKDVYGLSVREIAQEAGIEEGAGKVRLHRARRKLKELLEEEDRRAGEL